MVKFLDREREQSTGEKLMRGLGIAAQGIPDLINNYQKKKSLDQIGSTLPDHQKKIWDSLDIGMQEKLAPGIFTSMRQKEGNVEKLLSDSRRYLKGALSEADYFKYGEKAIPLYESFLKQGYPQSEARDLAIQQTRAGKDFAKPSESAEGEGLGFENLFGLAGPVVNDLANREAGEESDLNKGLGRTGAKGLMEGIREVGSELPGAVYKSATSPIAGLTLAGAGFPTAGAALAAAPVLTELARRKGVGLTPRELLAKEKPAGKETYFDNPFTKAQEWINEKARKGKTPQEREKAEETQNVLSTLLDLLGPLGVEKALGGKAISPSEILPPERAMIEAKPQQVQPRTVSPIKSAAKVPEKTKPIEPALKGRVTEAPETGTEKRMERVSPENRVYPRLENVALREKQLKSFPKYVEEINADAAERAERAEMKAPKTERGIESQQKRIQEAEKKYPVVQASYNKAAGRVRALEDEVVKLKGEARESGETLLELARKDLDDATFNLKQAYENLTGVNARAGVEGMRDAARTKMQDIQDAIASGEEYKIAKMDYSPDLITKANAITKSKPLPKARQSDFYTQVHDVYANEYRNRVGQIDKELKNRPAGLAGLYKARQLQAEKDILNKMIKSAEAEKAIQNRRFGLREMAERHKAQERFKQLKQDGAKPEVSKVAQERMWKAKIEEAKTPQERAAVVDEALEQIANEHPAQASRIRAEGEKLKDSIEDLFKLRDPLAPPSVKGEKVGFPGGTKKSPASPKPESPAKQPPPKGKAIPNAEELKAQPKSSSEAAKNGLTYIKHFHKKIDDLLSKIPIIGRHWIGRDIVFGTISAFVDELHKEYKIPLTGADAINILAGRPGYGGLRYLVRKLGKELAKWGIDEFKTRRAKGFYNEHDERFLRYSKRIQKEAKTRAIEE